MFKNKLTITFVLMIGFCFHTYAQSIYEEARNEYLYGDLKKAIVLFSTSIKNGEQIAKSYMYRGVAKSFLNDFTGAKSDLNASEEIDSDDFELYYYYGKYHYLKGEYNLSLNCFDKSIVLNKDFADSYDARALSRFLLEDYEGSIADENKAIQLNPKKYIYYTNRGNIFLQLNMYDEAINNFNHSIKIKPTSKAYTLSLIHI